VDVEVRLNARRVNNGCVEMEMIVWSEERVELAVKEKK
jgi:hypothetical protein